MTYTPREMRERQRSLMNYCDRLNAQPKAVVQTETHETETRDAKLKSCSGKPLRFVLRSDLRIDFLLGADGRPRDVKVAGGAPKAQRAAVRRFIESCSYEPFVVDGKPQAGATSMLIPGQQ